MLISSSLKSKSFYGSDLAYIHDNGYSYFALNAAPNILKILKKHEIHKGLVVDLGCGSGQWAEDIYNAGYKVCGVDISPAMIRIAKKRVPNAKFIRGSFLTAKLPKADAVTAMGEAINYLDSGKSMIRVFRKVFDALRPGGLFIFDVYEPAKSKPDQFQIHSRIDKDWAIYVVVNEDSAKNRLTRDITSFRQVGKNYRRTQEIHELRLFKGTVVAKWLRSIGFKFKTSRGYGSYKFPRSRCLAFVARKPSS